VFVTGFRDGDGGQWGALVPIKREGFDRLVLLSNMFTPHIDTDGTTSTR